MDTGFLDFFRKFSEEEEEEEELSCRVGFGKNMGSSSGQSSGYDLSFKILLIGDSGVGKSSLLVSFISSSVEDLAPTIGTCLASCLFLFLLF